MSKRGRASRDTMRYEIKLMDTYHRLRDGELLADTYYAYSLAEAKRYIEEAVGAIRNALYEGLK